MDMNCQTLHSLPEPENLSLKWSFSSSSALKPHYYHQEKIHPRMLEGLVCLHQIAAEESSAKYYPEVRWLCQVQGGFLP